MADPIFLHCEQHLKKNLPHHAKAGIVLACTFAVAGCGTPSARDFGGRWKPINQFQKDTIEIPLARPYTFFPAPMDGTLKTMLTRWANDAGMLLSYRMPSDFTLTAAASRINTPNIRAAATELNAVYAAQGVSISLNQRHIIVQPMTRSETDELTPPSNVPERAAEPDPT